MKVQLKIAVLLSGLFIGSKVLAVDSIGRFLSDGGELRISKPKLLTGYNLLLLKDSVLVLNLFEDTVSKCLKAADDIDIGNKIHSEYPHNFNPFPISSSKLVSAISYLLKDNNTYLILRLEGKMVNVEYIHHSGQKVIVSKLYGPDAIIEIVRQFE